MSLPTRKSYLEPAPMRMSGHSASACLPRLLRNAIPIRCTTASLIVCMKQPSPTCYLRLYLPPWHMQNAPAGSMVVVLLKPSSLAWMSRAISALRQLPDCVSFDQQRLGRSAQPSPADIAWARQAGIRTIVSLRAGSFGGDHLEREACARQGLAFERVIMRSRAAPLHESLREAMAVFPRLERPVLLHCKSGADRAGLATALYLMIVEGVSARDAKAQLSLRYGHFSSGRTGILDAFLAAYEETGEAEGIPFAEWVERVYDPDALTERFKPNGATDLLLALLRRE